MFQYVGTVFDSGELSIIRSKSKDSISCCFGWERFFLMCRVDRWLIVGGMNSQKGRWPRIVGWLDEVESEEVQSSAAGTHTVDPNRTLVIEVIK